jgi:hypothetical protein
MPHVTADDGIKLAYQVDDFSDPWLPDDPLLLLHAESLSTELVSDTLNVIMKRQSDITALDSRLKDLTRAAVEGPQGGAPAR